MLERREKEPLKLKARMYAIRRTQLNERPNSKGTSPRQLSIGGCQMNDVLFGLHQLVPWVLCDSPQALAGFSEVLR